MLASSRTPVRIDSLESIEIFRTSVPLAVPYKLAMGEVRAFESIVVAAHARGRTGYGEATYLLGYTDESIEAAWRSAQSFARRYVAAPLAEVMPEVLTHAHAAAFTVTAFTSAVDMLRAHPLLHVSQETRVPVLGLVNASQEPALSQELDALYAAGYRTLKIKVGFELEEDLAKVARIQRANRGRCALRIDANQGYTREEGCSFASRVEPDSIELFEQPCDKADWDAALAVSKVANVPMMLDESIYDLADIERAAVLGAARFIKLKLMKMGSLERCVAGIEKIRSLGLTPVLGNGVANDLGNWMEACLARGRIDNALESNGFLKPQRSPFAPPLRFEGGSIVLEPNVVPTVDGAALAAFALAHERVDA